MMRQSFLVLGLVVGASVALVTAQGRGFGPSKSPSAMRAIPAETTSAKVKDPNWKAPRTSWGHPDLEGTWSSDDMRGIPTSRPAPQADRESLTPEEFARRAGGDEASRDRAVNQETFLRIEFGVRTFGYTSFVVEPKDGRMPATGPETVLKVMGVSSRVVRGKSIDLSKTFTTEFVDAAR